MAKIRQSNLDNSIVTGLGDLGSNVSSTDQIVIYDQSSGTLKKISQTNFLNFPVVSSVSPTSVLSGDGTGNYTFTITGSGFTGASADLLNSSGTAVAFDSVTVDSSTQITGVIAKSSLPGSGEPYDVKVTAASGLKSTLDNQINIDQSPTYVTASGSLGSQTISTAGSFSVNATDPESAGNVTFELQSGSLPPGYSLTNTAAEGGTAIISGTDSTTSSDTTFNFVLRAVDAASNTSSRSFSITSRAIVSESFTSSGTFSVPSGVTTTDLLVVGGGAGGAAQHGGGGGSGGLVFFPSYPITPGGTITVTVGCGGSGGPHNSPSPLASSPGAPGLPGQNSVFGSPSDPGLGQGGVITAQGGGAGRGYSAGNGGDGHPGGSGGGAQGGGSSYSGGSATQPTQPGNSGAYGFGSGGGNASTQGGGGGGGGAGAGGSPTGGANGGPGGDGRAYTIADGTTPLYYAGGGGGGNHQGPEAGTGGQGGGGGGGHYCGAGPGVNEGQPGQANKGGGGGGSGNGGTPGAGGGKGIVIVRY